MNAQILLIVIVITLFTVISGDRWGQTDELVQRREGKWNVFWLRTHLSKEKLEEIIGKLEEENEEEQEGDYNNNDNNNNNDQGVEPQMQRETGQEKEKDKKSINTVSKENKKKPKNQNDKKNNHKTVIEEIPFISNSTNVSSITEGEMQLGTLSNITDPKSELERKEHLTNTTISLINCGNPTVVEDKSQTIAMIAQKQGKQINTGGILFVFIIILTFAGWIVFNTQYQNLKMKFTQENHKTSITEYLIIKEAEETNKTYHPNIWDI